MISDISYPSRFSKRGTVGTYNDAMDSADGLWQRLRQTASRVLKKHPWLRPVGVLLIGLEQVREALYDHANTGWAVLDWTFAAFCLLMFFVFILDTIAEYRSRTED